MKKVMVEMYQCESCNKNNHKGCYVRKCVSCGVEICAYCSGAKIDMCVDCTYQTFVKKKFLDTEAGHE